MLDIKQYNNNMLLGLLLAPVAPLGYEVRAPSNSGPAQHAHIDADWSVTLNSTRCTHAVITHTHDASAYMAKLLNYTLYHG